MRSWIQYDFAFLCMKNHRQHAPPRYTPNRSDKLEPYIIITALNEKGSRLFSLTSAQIKNCEVAIAQFKATFGLDTDSFHYTGSDERLETNRWYFTMLRNDSPHPVAPEVAPRYQFGRECKPWSHIRSVLFSEAGEKDEANQSDPSSPSFGSKHLRDELDNGDSEDHALKKSRGNELSGEDQEGFSEACSKVAVFFSGNTFPCIPKSVMESMAESAAAAACAHIVMTKSIAFPFHRQFTSDDEVKKMVSRLRSCSARALLRDDPFDCREMEGSPLRVHTKFKPAASAPTRFMIFKPNDPVDFQSMDRLTDVFVEPSRLLSFRSIPKVKTDSILKGWRDDIAFVRTCISGAITRAKKSGNDILPSDLREAVWEATKGGPPRYAVKYTECANERPSFLVCVMHQLKDMLDGRPLRIFDAAAGWGDRLIAAMVVDADRYVGVDPNSNSKPCFSAAVEAIKGPQGHAKYEILCDGCPGVVLPQDCCEGSMNVAFLSPPAFDSEFYSDDAAQSVNVFPDRETWLVKFLFATIDKCWALLQPGGFLVVQSMLCKEILPYIAWACPNSWYVGVIAVQTTGKRNKPLWVWRKLGSTAPSPVRFEDAVSVWGYRVANQIFTLKRFKK